MISFQNETAERSGNRYEKFPKDFAVSFENICVTYGNHRVLKDAPIFVFDEPTAALDAGSESKILDTILMLKQERKCILLITHKASTLHVADRILKIEGGKVFQV